MNKRVFVLASLLLIPFVVPAQVAGEIVIEGKVIDISTNKGLKAVIRYKSLPTGGITGNFNDSTYKFSIFGASKYQVTAELQGYITGLVIVDPKKMDASGKVIRNITLTPKGQTIRLTHLIFQQGKSVIEPESFDELDEIVSMMNNNPKLVIQLEGHTDNLGNASKNMELSQDRVDEVKEYLVDKGVGKSRVKTKAFGGTQPLSKGTTPEVRNLNRRVEVRILSE